MNPVQQISNKLNTYSEQFPSVLEDYKKSYVIHNKNPEYNEYFSSPDAFFDCLTFGTEGIAPDRGQPKVNISFR